MKLFSVLLMAVATLSMGDYVMPKASADDSVEKCRGRNCDRPRPNRPGRGGGVDRPRPNRPRPDVNRPRPNRPRPDRPRPDVNRPRPNRPAPDVNRPRPNRPRPDVNRPRPNRPRPDVNRPRPHRPRPDINRPRPNRPDYRPHRPRPTRPDWTRPRPPQRPRYRRPVRRTTWDVSWGWRRHRRHMHRPLWYIPTYTYTYYTHVPYRYTTVHHSRWSRAMYYHYTLPYRYIYWNRWVRVRHHRVNGYFWHNSYPYFIYNGYRHRYSSSDMCNYELVDGRNNTTERVFHTYTCKVGYDMCADVRDRMNRYEGSYRYFCSEKFSRDSNYNYNWNYSEDYWSDCNDESSDYGRNDYDDYDFGTYDRYDDYVTDHNNDDYYDSDDYYNDDDYYDDDYGWEDDWS